MPVVLNFSGEEKKEVKQLLSRFKEKKTTSKFEEMRVKVNDCTVTLYSSGKLLVQGKSTEKIKAQLLHTLGLKSELLPGIDETGKTEL